MARLAIEYLKDEGCFKTFVDQIYWIWQIICDLVSMYSVLCTMLIVLVNFG